MNRFADLVFCRRCADRSRCLPQAKRGQGGKEPVKKQSREEKTQGGKEQEEEGPGRLAIHARTDNWERRFRQEILVAQCARSGVQDSENAVYQILAENAASELCSISRIKAEFLIQVDTPFGFGGMIARWSGRSL